MFKFLRLIFTALEQNKNQIENNKNITFFHVFPDYKEKYKENTNVTTVQYTNLFQSSIRNVYNNIFNLEQDFWSKRRSEFKS